jgi:riboflavin synthase
MFTGLIEEIGTLIEARAFAGGRRLRVSAPGIAGGLAPGESVACNGVCLTVERCDAGAFTVAAVHETLRRTTAGRWRRGSRLHLERAMRADGRFGGHLVQGHVDGMGRVVRAGRLGSEFALTVRVPAALRRYLVAKGSLAVEGVSLTVGELHGDACRLYLVPETCARTRLALLLPGEPVNLEVDLTAKYIEALLPARVRDRREATRVTGDEA